MGLFNKKGDGFLSFLLFSLFNEDNEFEKSNNSFDDYLTDEEKALKAAGIDIFDFISMSDLERKDLLESKGLNPVDFIYYFHVNDLSELDMTETERRLDAAGIYVDLFKEMDDKSKRDFLIHMDLDPNDFIELFDVDSIEELEQIVDENSDNKIAEQTQVSEESLYTNPLYNISEIYGLSFKKVCDIAKANNHNMISILAVISGMSDEEKLATFIPECRVRFLTGADIEVCREYLSKCNGDEAEAIKMIKDTNFKKHITCLMMAKVNEATNVAYLETRKFLLETNGDIEKAVKLIEQLPPEKRKAITVVNNDE